MVDQDTFRAQVFANLDKDLDQCRRALASPDTCNLALVRRLYERVDELLDQRSALTHDQHA